MWFSIHVFLLSSVFDLTLLLHSHLICMRPTQILDCIFFCQLTIHLFFYLPLSIGVACIVPYGTNKNRGLNVDEILTNGLDIQLTPSEHFCYSSACYSRAWCFPVNTSDPLLVILEHDVSKKHELPAWLLHLLGWSFTLIVYTLHLLHILHLFVSVPCCPVQEMQPHIYLNSFYSSLYN